MEKKLYSMPQVEVINLKTVDLLRPTDLSTNGPTPPGYAPAHHAPRGGDFIG